MAKKKATAPDLDSLRANPRNPRQISDVKTKMLKAAMERFGDLGGVVWNRQTGHLVGGHQRRSVMDQTAPIVRTAEYPLPTRTGTVAEGYIQLGGENFTYREVDWPADVEAAAMIAANKQAGDWQMQELTDLLQELTADGFDMDLTMFSDEELSAMLDVEQLDQVGDADEDAPPEMPAETTAKAGDIWTLGEHRLMCGDSSNPQHVDALMAGAKAQMVYTDPPYGMNLKTDYATGREKLDNSKYSKHAATKGIKRNKWRPVHGDDEAYDPGFLLSYFADVPEIFLWGADYYCQLLPQEGSWIVWDKRSKEDGTVIEQFKASHFELCWSKTKHLREIARILWSGIMKAEKDGARVHPTQKPVMLADWFFERWGKEGDVVVDLYGGSGSTLLACQKAKRKCYMLEIDAGYVDVIIARWEKMTGQRAERAED